MDHSVYEKKHKNWKCAILEPIELMTPDWSHLKEFKQSFSLLDGTYLVIVALRAVRIIMVKVEQV